MRECAACGLRFCDGVQCYLDERERPEEEACIGCDRPFVNGYCRYCEETEEEQRRFLAEREMRLTEVRGDPFLAKKRRAV